MRSIASEMPLVNPVRSVSFITLGCAKNEVDTYEMKKRLAAAGYFVEAEPQDAQVIIVNTCSFIQPATEESIEVIFECTELASVVEGGATIIVAGCMPSRYGESLAEALGEIEHFVPCSKEDDILSVVDAIFAAHVGDSAYEPVSLPAYGTLSAPRYSETGVFAYVKISDGCNRCCSFCAIPSIRGSYRSYDFDFIRASVIDRIEGGAREIVLIAQDTGIWGYDLEEPHTLAWLLDQLASEFESIWFRVMYLEPGGVSDELLAVMGSHENICSYLDIPLQHVSPEVLHAMNRSGSREEYEALFERILEAIPDVTLRTTLIAGFPGETEEQFDELCDFVEDAPFSYIGVFPYSREEGTKAYDLPDQLEEEDKAERAQTLRDLADTVCSARVSQRIGSRIEVLVEGAEEDGQLYGRAQCQAPEVDGVTYLSEGSVGEVVKITVFDTLLYEMEGE